MIDDVTFTAQWAILEDRFQTRHNAETAALYLEALDEELTTEQFLVACRRAFRYETFFPSPQNLIDHALGDFAAQADAAWDDIMLRWGGNQSVLTDEGSLSRKILNIIGGAHTLRNANDYGLRDMREQFLRRYARALRGDATPQIKKAQELAAPALAPDPEVRQPLEGARGKAVDFLNMARMSGIGVHVSKRKEQLRAEQEQAAD